MTAGRVATMSKSFDQTAIAEHQSATGKQRSYGLPRDDGQKLLRIARLIVRSGKCWQQSDFKS